MKKKLIYLGLTGCILFALCTKLQAQIDSLQAHRYVTRATMYGIGFTNVFDTCHQRNIRESTSAFPAKQSV